MHSTTTGSHPPAPEPRERQPRERAVPCQGCRRETWELDAICPGCAARRTQMARTRPARTCEVCAGLAVMTARPAHRGTAAWSTVPCPACAGSGLHLERPAARP